MEIKREIHKRYLEQFGDDLNSRIDIYRIKITPFDISRGEVRLQVAFYGHDADSGYKGCLFTLETNSVLFENDKLDIGFGDKPLEMDKSLLAVTEHK